MSKTSIGQLEALVRRLQKERQTHVDAIAEIDAAFEQLGVTVPARKRRGRKPGRTKKKASATRGKKRATKKKAKRRTFKMTANELVLATIKKAGAKGATGAQITKAWKTAKRPGDAYNTLGALVNEKKIKRAKVKGGRGSVYRIA
jgi:CxxC motif-containing protein (DUF1111 family)